MNRLDFVFGAFVLASLALVVITRIALTPLGNEKPAPAKSPERWSPPASASWPVFRGDPSLCGEAPGSLGDALSLLWTAEADGPVHSSPVVASGLAIVGTDAGSVLALDLATGELRWSFPAGAPVEAPPLVVDDTVYVGSGDGSFFALGLGHGKLLWKERAGEKIVGSANGIRDGEGRIRVLVGSHDSRLWCFDGGTGETLWTFEAESYINGAPAFHGGVAVFGGCDAKVYQVDVVRGVERSSVDAGSYIASSPAVRGGRAYVGHYEGELLSVDLVEARVLWRYAGGDGAAFFSPVAVSGGIVVAGCRDGGVHCVNASNGKARWTFATDGDVDSGPVVCGSRVLAASTDGTLYLLRLDDGSAVWSFPVGAPMTGSPAVAGGMVVIGAEDGRVYAFGPTLYDKSR